MYKSKIAAWKEEGFVEKALKEGAIVLMSSFVLGLFSNLSIPLPFSPVPIATQPHVALFLGALLGAKRGAAAVALFLLQGVFGLPVFAGGAFGIAKLIGPTGGYLLGYMVAAFVVGAIFERKKGIKGFSSFLTLSLGNLLIYALGASYLATFIGVKQALLVGVAPFLLGDLLKNVIVAKMVDWKGAFSRFLKRKEG